jgi:prepilin-type processing-associated H-X9-DG protein
VPWKISPADTPGTILAFDRSPCHGGRRNVLFVDLSVETVEEAKFQKMLAADRARFTGAPAEKAPSEPKKSAKKIRKQE